MFAAAPHAAKHRTSKIKGTTISLETRGVCVCVCVVIAVSQLLMLSKAFNQLNIIPSINQL
jgi:hypothetical protein